MLRGVRLFFRATPLAEIRERQRALEAARPRGVAPSRDIPSNFDETPPLVESAVKARLPQALFRWGQSSFL